MKQKLLLKSMLLLFALIAGSSSVWADNAVITFANLDSGTGDSGTELSTSNFVSNGIASSSAAFGTISCSATAKCYKGKVDHGLKAGASSNAGSFTIAFSTPLTNVTQITLNRASYNDSKTATITVKNGSTTLANAVSTPASSAEFADMDITGLSITSLAGLTVETNKYCYIKSITITYSSAGTTAAPSITGDTPFLTNTTVTISNDASADGAAIYYTLNGDDPTTTTSATCFAYSAPFSIDATTTVKAIAKKSTDTNASPVVSKTFTKITPLANIAALTAKTETGTYYVTLDDAVVTYVNGKYAYIQDASGAVVYYADSHTLEAGKVLNGIATVSYQLQKNNPQITALSGITPTDGVAPAPSSLKQSEWTYTFSDVLSQYFEITNATITQSDSKYYVSLNGDDVQLYKVGGGLSISDLTKKYTITGFPMLYNSTKELQIFAAPVEEVSTVPAIAATPTSRTGFTYIVGEGPSAAQTISVSGSNLTEDISLSLGASSNFEMSQTEGSGYTNSLTLSPTAGTIAATTIYVRLKAGLAISDSYAGTITLTSAGADNVEVTLAGSVTATNFTWDLSKSSSVSATEDLVTWASTYATMTLAKSTSTTDANNYLGGGSNNHTRFYQNQILKITPVPGYSIVKAEITSTSSSYVAGFTGNDWTNASKSTSGSLVTITPTNGKEAFYVTISAACRATAVKVYYEDADGAVVTITGAGWASFSCTKALDFTGTGVTAYIAKEKDASNVTLSEIAKVPASTGMVVNAPAGTYAIPVLTDAADATTGNLLQPWLTAGTPTAGTYYTLAVDGGGNPIFKKSSGGTLAAGKAYLDLSGASAPVLNINFGDGNTTSVSDVRSKMEEGRGEFYNLNGQRVAQPTKGLYIVNGKKVIIK